jgi:KaiC/GvpD/RAD55 family RecA-like ATPase
MAQIKRIPLYIKGLDENIQGGVPEKHIMLISGSAGTMKSSVTFNILYNEALKGKTGIYLSLEQSYESLVTHVLNMGYDLNQVNMIHVNELQSLLPTLKDNSNTQKGNVIIIDMGCIRKEIKDMKISGNRSWMNVIKNIIIRTRQVVPCEIFILDSMSALYVLSNFDNPRIELFFIFEFLRDSGMTSFLISEMPLDGSRFSEYEVEDYLADGIVRLRLAELRRSVVREIQVVKLRATKANNDIFSLVYQGGEFQALYGGKTPLL